MCYILFLDGGSSPPRGEMTGRCFMMLLGFPSDFCMMMLYFCVTRRGVLHDLLVLTCGGDVLDDWMG
jgi:hypothetical protein